MNSLKYPLGVIISVILCTLQASQLDTRIAIIGAGPAGIATLGVMLEAGIPPAEIMWIDGTQEHDPQAFNVGALGTCYSTVSGNSKTKLYVKFLQTCKVFRECRDEHFEALEKIDPEFECDLIHIVKPLQTVTNHLRRLVRSYAGKLQSLSFVDNHWVLKTGQKEFTAHMVVLATGSHPKVLDYQGLSLIPLEVALNKQQLATIIQPTDTIALFGGAHSAILLLKHLTNLQVHKVINFYTKPISFAVDMGNWTQNQVAGLKGSTAKWAQEVLLKNPPACIERYEYTPENIATHLPRCNKVIYAIGFAQNQITGISSQDGKIAYDDTTGAIGPRLFGIGIAFPHKYVDPQGSIEHPVGLTSFIEYAQRIVPHWLQTRTLRNLQYLREFEELFTIQLL